MNLRLTRLEKRFDLDRYLEGYDGKLVDDNFITFCPVCEKDGKLYILTKDKRDANGERIRRGAWICYHCTGVDGMGTGRTCLSLIEWMESIDWMEAIKRLAEGGTSADADFIGNLEKLMDELEEDDGEDKTELPAITLPKEFIRIDEKHVPKYLSVRGISVERAMRFRLGYCESGYFANRLIAPVYFEGVCRGFQARYMKPKPPMCTASKLPCSLCNGKTEHKRAKKTLHGKGAKMSRVLYNYDVARLEKRLVLVEDPWSAIAIGKQGVAAFGTHLSSAQIELLMKTEAREIVLIWDRDEGAKPGQGGYDKSVEFAQKLASVVPVRAVRLPDSRDPDEVPKAELAQIIDQTPLLTSTDAWAVRVGRRLSWL